MCERTKDDIPSESTEARGRWVGVAEHVGHTMTYKILTDDTQKIIYRSNVRSALSSTDRNKRVDPLRGEDIPSIVKSPDLAQKSLVTRPSAQHDT